MKTKRTRIAPVVSAFLLGLSSVAAGGAPPPDFSPIEESIRAEMKSQGVPGAAVVVVVDGRVAHRAVFGVESVETGRPVREDSLFRLGSTTKTFVAIAALQLVQSGRLDLHAAISKYAPELDASLGQLTMDQLLSHTAGLRDDAPMRGPLEESALGARVRSWNRDAFFTRPGEIFSYANPGYVLAGWIVERVAGKPFADAVHELVLAPLGMERSTFRPLEAMTRPLALGHHPGPNGPEVVRPFAEDAANWPPGSLFTDLDDMGRFLRALVSDGQIDGRPALPAPVIRAVSSPHAEVAALDRRYGYGLELRTERGVEVVEHTGARLGYGSIVWTVPSRGFAVAIMTNRSGAIFFESARKAMAAALALSPEEPAPGPAPAAMTAEEMQRAAGSYVNSASIRAELYVEKGRLFARSPANPTRPAEVRKIGPDRYAADGAGPLSSFRLVPAENGNPAPTYLLVEHWAARRVEKGSGAAEEKK
jgi:CubicO group peptidase (beta-lactamase class C family)